MEKLIIQPSSSTPAINFDPVGGVFEISGKSLPENTFDFFQPIHEFLDNYSARPADRTELIFKLEYFNTSSTSQFLKVIRKMEKLFESGATVAVKWYYEADDEDMKEAGEDFKLLLKLPIEILSTEVLN